MLHRDLNNGYQAWVGLALVFSWETSFTVGPFRSGRFLSPRQPVHRRWPEDTRKNPRSRNRGRTSGLTAAQLYWAILGSAGYNSCRLISTGSDNECGEFWLKVIILRRIFILQSFYMTLHLDTFFRVCRSLVVPKPSSASRIPRSIIYYSKHLQLGKRCGKEKHILNWVSRILVVAASVVCVFLGFRAAAWETGREQKNPLSLPLPFFHYFLSGRGVGCLHDTGTNILFWLEFVQVPSSRGRRPFVFDK